MGDTNRWGRRRKRRGGAWRAWGAHARLAAAGVSEVLLVLLRRLALHRRVDLARLRVGAEGAAEEEDVRLRAGWG